MNTNRTKVYCDLGQEHPASFISTQQERLELLQESCRQNQFDRFQAELSQPMKDQPSITWRDHLQSYNSSRTIPRVTDMDFLCAYLFAAALCDSPEKHTEIATILYSLSSEHQKLFFQKLLVLPPIMGAHILRLSSDFVWSSIIYKAKHNYSIVIQWIEMAVTHFSPVEAQHFVSTVFNSYATEELLLTYLIQASATTQQSIKQLLSPEAIKGCSSIKATLDAMVRQFFMNLQGLRSTPLPIASLERQYILQQAAFQAFENPHICKIIHIFSETDWQWFYSQIPSKKTEDFPDLVISWGLQKRATNGKLDFLRHLPSILPEKDLLRLCRLLAENHFFSEISSRLSPFQEKCILSFARQAPNLLNSWIHHLLNDVNPMTMASTISSLLAPLKEDNLNIFLPYLFEEHISKPNYAITVYACLPQAKRAVVLRYLLENNQMKILNDWMKLLFLPSNRPIDPFVRYACLQDLYTLISSIDPSVPVKLKEQIQAFAPDEIHNIIDLYLPTEIDLSLPEERQKIALQKCIRYFSDPQIKLYGRFAWTQNILADFQENLQLDVWIEALLENISHDRWPLLFRVFHLEIWSIFKIQKPDRINLWIERACTTLENITLISLNAEESLHYTTDLLQTLPLTDPNDMTLLIEQLLITPQQCLPSLSLLYDYYCHQKQAKNFQELLSSVFRKYPPFFFTERLLAFPQIEDSKLEQILWGEMAERWKQTTPSQSQFYAHIEMLRDLQASNDVKNRLTNRLCQTYLQVECNVFKWLQERRDLLNVIKPWYLTSTQSSDWKVSLLSVGFWNLLSPNTLTSMLSHKMPTWDIAALEELFQILNQLDLTEEYLLHLSSSRNFLLQLDVNPTGQPHLFRACAKVRNQQDTSCSCVVS